MNATGRESEWFVLNAPFHRGKFLCQQSHVADHLALFAELVWLPSVVSRHGGVTGDRRCVMVPLQDAIRNSICLYLSSNQVSIGHEPGGLVGTI